MIQETDALGKQRRYGYNADGDLIRTATQVGAQWMVTCSAYDASALLLKVWGPAVTASDTTCPAAAPPTTVVDYAYDDLNRLVSETRNLPAGEGGNRTTQVVYGLDGRTQSLIRAVGTGLAQAEATYTYTLNGRLATITDAKGNRTTYVYDGFDRTLRKLFPDKVTPNTSSNTDFEQYGFDAAGNPVSRRTRSGQTIAFAYDKLHRPIARTYPNAADNVTYSYDLMGRLQSANYADGSHAVTNAWDHASRLVGTTAGGRTLSYQYDAAGNRIRTTWPEATPFFVTTTFDALNRASSMLELGTTLLASYAYDDLSRRTSATFGNGTSASAAYSAQADLASLAHNFAGSSADVSFGYSRNQAREITGVNASNPLYKWTGSAPGTRPYVANGLNQYSSVAGTTFTYDGNGNLAGDGVWSYAYDPENRLRAASGNGTAASLAWDGLGRRRQTTIGGSATDLLYDGPAPRLAEYDGAGNLLRRFRARPGSG
ncbi:MAG: RHS repeat protein [Betaproteobacteria bacterium]|nr:RHS repeat protein [Betaproteobacteria bacterium]